VDGSTGDFDFLDVTVNGSRCTLQNDKVFTTSIAGKWNGASWSIDPFNFTCPNNTATPVNGAFSPINDAHFFATAVSNMYNDWFSIDPHTSSLVMLTDWVDPFNGNTTNAFWDGDALHFGNGNSDVYPYTVLDIVSHEIAHAFTEINANLIYDEQSGGMNEAFSDMAGKAAEYYVRGSNTWLLGLDLNKGEHTGRHMNDPTADGVSIDHLDDFVPVTDVHHTSGVYNKAFYNLATTQGWNTRTAFEVMVGANQNYWTASSTFEEGFCGVLSSTEDLGYATNDVISAFAGVGIQDVKLTSPQAGSAFFVDEAGLITLDTTLCSGGSTGVSASVRINGGSSLNLFDNGTHGDVQAGDGIFTQEWTPTSEGDNNVAINATKDGRQYNLQRTFYVGADNVSYSVEPTAYNWVSALDRCVGPNHDDGKVELALGIDFNFFGIEYDTAYVSSNGFLSFSPFSVSAHKNMELPNESNLKTIIATYWDDLNPEAGGQVCSAVIGSAPNRQVVITWQNMASWLDTSPATTVSNAVTAQVILHENSGDIVMQYQDVQSGNTSIDFGRSATVGIENSDGQRVLMHSFNTAVIQNQSALRFSQGLNADSDGDGINDDVDNCPNIVNKGQWDLDSDSIGNECDADIDGDGFSNAYEESLKTLAWKSLSYPGADSDNDGILEENDNCPTIANPFQWDKDQDGRGNECDSDIDGDGYSNNAEIAAKTKVWDATSFPDSGLDNDGDTIINGLDNCINNANKYQSDNDGDGLGDHCDTDRDGDGYSNAEEKAAGVSSWDASVFPGWNVDTDGDTRVDGLDNCPNVSNFGQWDDDKDNIGNDCDDDIDGDGASNDAEIAAGTFVADPTSFPARL